ncbi:MAG: NAD(P)H-binding protein, partial [Nitrospiraceae bacterium]
MTRVLITGAAGFIGRRLVTALSNRGYSVRALVHRPTDLTAFQEPVEVVVGDVEDSAAMKG